MKRPDKQRAKPAEVGTTGQEWDGIQELNNPLPRWWLWCLYATIIWGVGYTIAYPAWPMLTQATQGLIGGSARADVAADIARFDEANAAIKARLVAADLTQIEAQQDLSAFAQNAGAAVFRTNCATCHGAGAAGVVGKGYPNLLDDDWLWGGDIDAILTTITHGIRNNQDLDSRYSQMPAFGVDGILEDPQIAATVEHVLAISGAEHDATLAAEGAVVYAENCAVCHGDAGAGDQEQGAPNLTDAIWLYGGTREAVTYSIVNARFGVMPPWAGRLSEDELRAVAVYVHSRGGGE
jgi:cytochrome c oxidase cbb3-type subunit III